MYRFATTLLLCAAAWAQPVAALSSVEAKDARRSHELKIPEIIEAMALAPGGSVADIGAGDGLYEVFLSKAAGAQGHVYAEDIDENGAIKRLRERVHDQHLDNVEVILGAADDPKLPVNALDSVLMVIMYHEIENHQAMLEHVKAALKPGGRLVIVDMMPHKTITRPRADQTKNHVIAASLVESEVRDAGFGVVFRDDHFIDNPDEESTRWMIVFRKPARP